MVANQLSTVFWHCHRFNWCCYSSSSSYDSQPNHWVQAEHLFRHERSVSSGGPATGTLHDSRGERKIPGRGARGIALSSGAAAVTDLSLRLGPLGPASEHMTVYADVSIDNTASSVSGALAMTPCLAIHRQALPVYFSGWMILRRCAL